MSELTKEGLILSTPEDLKVKCSCGEELDGKGRAQELTDAIRYWAARHQREGHTLRIEDPDKYMERFPDKRPN